MEFLSIFALVLGVTILLAVAAVAIMFPFSWIFDWGDRKYGFGVGFGAGLLWMVFAASLIIAVGYYTFGLR